MARECKKRGGDYTVDEERGQDERQEGLEKEESDRRKREGEGRFVGSTGTARRERKEGSEGGEGEGEEGVKAGAGQKRKATADNGNAGGLKKRKAGKKVDEEKEEDVQEEKEDDKKSKDPKAKQGNAPPGKVGSKHMDAKEPGPRGSSDRLPQKGDKVTWKAMPGYVDGELVEVVTSNKKVQGKDVKGSKSDPKLVLKSSSSGKICVHKPDACFYE